MSCFDTDTKSAKQRYNETFAMQIGDINRQITVAVNLMQYSINITINNASHIPHSHILNLINHYKLLGYHVTTATASSDKTVTYMKIDWWPAPAAHPDGSDAV